MEFPYLFFYTPDGNWWNHTQRNYDRVGGNIFDGLRCGSSCLDLKYAAGSRDWNIGASRCPIRVVRR